jgi:predicted nucleic acid-binding protein
MASDLIIDTNIVIDFLQGRISPSDWSMTLNGRSPKVTPAIVHELRRIVRPGSPTEKNWATLLPPASLMTDSPSSEDWVFAADLIRQYFFGSRKGAGLARLTTDALNCAIAHRIGAEIWSRDQDYQTLCAGLSVVLYR